jgi:hypothetical protein
MYRESLPIRLVHALVPIAWVAVALGLLLLTSRGGPGVSSESVGYLDVARALASGAGYVAEIGAVRLPMTHYPPLYPLALAAVGAFTKDLVSGALYLNIAIRAILLIIVWFGLTRTARLGPMPAGIALGFLAVSPDLTDAHAMVWSEPLFYVISVAALFLLASHLGSRRRLPLATASLLLAAAVLTRYAGLGLLPGALLLLILQLDRPWRARCIDLGVYACFAVLPVLLWSLRNHAVTLPSHVWPFPAEPFQRTLAFHAPTPEDWRQGSSSLSFSLCPHRVSAIVGAPFVLTIAGLALFLVLRRTRIGKGSPPTSAGIVCARVFLVAGFSYLASVVVARSLADAAIAFSSRILSPAFVYFVIGVVASYSSRAFSGLFVKRLAVIVAAPFILSLLWHASLMALRGPSDPLYAGEHYARMARELAASQRTIAYSNDPFFLRYYFSSTAPALPFRSDPFSNATNPLFESEVRALGPDLAATHRTVLYVIPAQERNPTLDELVSLGRLHIEARGTNWVLLSPEKFE